MNTPTLDQFRHLPVEEGEQQRSDVRAVDVRVSHQDDLVITQLADIEVVLADAGAESGDQRLDLAVAAILSARLLDVQDFALERQDGLVLSVTRPCFAEPPAESPRRCRSRRAPVAFLAVSQFAGEHA